MLERYNNVSFARLMLFKLEQPSQIVQPVSTFSSIKTDETRSDREFQARLDAIAYEMERRNNLGYGLGIALGRAIGTRNENILSLKEINTSEKLIENPTGLNYLVDKISKYMYRFTLDIFGGYTELHHAVVNKEYEKILALSKQEDLINAENYIGNSPLHFAAAQGDLKAVQILIENGALIDVLNKNGKSPIFFASYALFECIKNKKNKFSNFSSKEFYDKVIAPINMEQSPISCVEYESNKLIELEKIIDILINHGANIEVAFSSILSLEGYEKIDLLIDYYIKKLNLKKSDEKLNFDKNNPQNKNSDTTLFENIIRYILRYPEKVGFKETIVDNRSVYEISLDGHSYNISEICQSMDWEQLNFIDQDYQLYSEKYAQHFTKDFSEVKDAILNSVDLYLLHWFSKDLGYHANDFLSGSKVRCMRLPNYKSCNPIEFKQLLTSIALLANAINKNAAHVANPAHFVCRGQAYADLLERAKFQLFISTSSSYKVCDLYANIGKGAEIERKTGNILFFPESIGQSISAEVSSVQNAKEYVSVPKRVSILDKKITASKENGGPSMHHFFGKAITPKSEKTYQDDLTCDQNDCFFKRNP
jgi:hypothetical protein